MWLKLLRWLSRDEEAVDVDEEIQKCEYQKLSGSPAGEFTWN